MRSRLFIKTWEQVRTSFWFTPTVMALASVGLFFITISFDYELERKWANSIWYVYSGGSDGAMSLLSTVAGSMITVTGVVFSITIVAFTLASQQFSPRLLRNYMRDPGNQITLGSFIGTFLYCILVLRTVKGVKDDEFVPHVSLTIAVALALFSLAVLIYFIHHAASSIQAESIVNNLGHELTHGIKRLFPEMLGEGGRTEAELKPSELGLLERLEEAGAVLAAEDSAYLQAIDGDRVIAFAREHDAVLRVCRRPGDFVTQGSPLIRIWPLNVAEESEELREAFLFGTQRTDTQDYEFVIQQIVEVALRALSPSLNDPFTACSCLDRLTAALVLLVPREFPRPYRVDPEGGLRLALHPVTFPALLDASFHQIRQSADGSVAVLIKMLESLTVIARQVRHRDRAKALLRHGEMVLRKSEETVPEQNDRADVRARFDALADAVAHPAYDLAG